MIKKKQDTKGSFRPLLKWITGNLTNIVNLQKLTKLIKGIIEKEQVNEKYMITNKNHSR